MGRPILSFSEGERIEALWNEGKDFRFRGYFSGRIEKVGRRTSRRGRSEVTRSFSVRFDDGSFENFVSEANIRAAKPRDGAYLARLSRKTTTAVPSVLSPQQSSRKKKKRTGFTLSLELHFGESGVLQGFGHRRNGRDEVLTDGSWKRADADVEDCRAPAVLLAFRWQDMLLKGRIDGFGCAKGSWIKNSSSIATAATRKESATSPRRSGTALQNKSGIWSLRPAFELPDATSKASDWVGYVFVERNEGSLPDEEFVVTDVTADGAVRYVAVVPKYGAEVNHFECAPAELRQCLRTSLRFVRKPNEKEMRDATELAKAKWGDAVRGKNERTAADFYAAPETNAEKTASSSLPSAKKHMRGGASREKKSAATTKKPSRCQEHRRQQDSGRSVDVFSTEMNDVKRFVDRDGTSISFIVRRDISTGEPKALEEWCDGSLEIANVERVDILHGEESIFDGQETIPLKSDDFAPIVGWLLDFASKVPSCAIHVYEPKRAASSSTTTTRDILDVKACGSDVDLFNIVSTKRKKRRSCRLDPPSSADVATEIATAEATKKKRKTTSNDERRMESPTGFSPPASTTSRNRISFVDADGTKIDFVIRDDTNALEEWCDGTLEMPSVTRLDLRADNRTIFDGSEHIPLRSKADYESVARWLRCSTAGSVCTIVDSASPPSTLRPSSPAVKGDTRKLSSPGDLSRVDLANIVDTKTRRKHDANSSSPSPQQPGICRRRADSDRPKRRGHPSPKLSATTLAAIASPATTVPLSAIAGETSSDFCSPSSPLLSFARRSQHERVTKKRKRVAVCEFAPPPVLSALATVAAASVADHRRQGRGDDCSTATTERLDDAEATATVEYPCTFVDADGTRISFKVVVVASFDTDATKIVKRTLQEWCDERLEIDEVKRIDIMETSKSIFDGVETIPLREKDYARVVAWFMDAAPHISTDIVFAETDAATTHSSQQFLASGIRKTSAVTSSQVNLANVVGNRTRRRGRAEQRNASSSPPTASDEVAKKNERSAETRRPSRILAKCDPSSSSAAITTTSPTASQCSFVDDDGSSISFIARKNGGVEERCDGEVVIPSIRRIVVRNDRLELFDGSETIPFRERKEFFRVVAWLQLNVPSTTSRLCFEDEDKVQGDNEKETKQIRCVAESSSDDIPDVSTKKTTAASPARTLARRCSLSSVRSPNSETKRRRRLLLGFSFLVTGFSSSTNPTDTRIVGRIKSLGGRVLQSCHEAVALVENGGLSGRRESEDGAFYSSPSASRLARIVTVAIPSAHRTAKYLFAVANVHSGGAPVHPEWILSHRAWRDLATSDDPDGNDDTVVRESERFARVLHSASPYRLPRGFCTAHRIFHFGDADARWQNAAEEKADDIKAPLKDMVICLRAPNKRVYDEYAALLRIAGARKVVVGGYDDCDCTVVVSLKASSSLEESDDCGGKKERTKTSRRRKAKNVVVAFDWVVQSLIRRERQAFSQFGLGHFFANRQTRVVRRIENRFPCAPGEFVEIRGDTTSAASLGRVVALVGEKGSSEASHVRVEEMVVDRDGGVRPRESQESKSGTGKKVSSFQRSSSSASSRTKKAHCVTRCYGAGNITRRVVVLTPRHRNRHRDLAALSDIYFLRE
eukprot:g3094.t1